MALLLCIDTATEQAFVGLCKGSEIINSISNNDPKNHSAFLQTTVQNMMQAADVSFSQIDAFAVVNGPGSYTGLRVGLASAKGICYAAGKPLILLNTLEVMALAATRQYNDTEALYCPMIDARRNEVFTALYNFSLEIVLPPQPLMLSPDSFASQPAQKIYFLGSGHKKCKLIIRRENAVFVNIAYNIGHINELAQHSYAYKQLSDIAYAEPFYTKEFYLPGK